MVDEWEILEYIAKKSGLYGSFDSSTIKLAKDLIISQQTVSRKLMELENRGLIKRDVSPQGINLKLDNKGKEHLRKRYDELKKLFGSLNKLNMNVVSGLGEGKHYTDVYKKKIKEIFGFDTYPGTLNLKGNKEKISSFLSDLTYVKVDSFKKGDRTYGVINCYDVLMNDLKCVIVVPERTSHDKNTLEIISEFNLRDKLKIEDGDEVMLCQK